MTRFKVSGLLFAALLLTPFAAQAQAPTQAQQEAIRSQCRSDFMSNCSSVTPGGREALECLVRNKAHVSGGCQAALNAISAPAPAAAAKPEAKPEIKPEAKPEPKAAKAPATKTPAHPAAPKAATTKAATPAPDLAAAPPAAEAAPAAPPRPMRLGEALMVRRFCATDFKTLCKGVQIGQGRAVQCLVDNREALSPGCKQAMADTGR